ncbi:src kinase-associated phosphoprotein 2-like isoform X1 [Platichthys flesus]|uniref:src kinase-associated phosphoprotein 2-like isoform X1 n=1 Tax=Platichthys flesus TaxID=8260 RepID=UPI002DBD9CBA|nr:src kinase-associated phosphoprotein 2-like isoform X1 [Platichthys flesus]
MNMNMNISGIHHGTLRMHGGFIFKQWKKRFLLLTAEGSLLVCHDVSSPPDQLVMLQSSCEAIVEGKEILDLPKLPSSGCRDCCFALILPQNKYLLLLAETPADCSQWVNVLKKVKMSLSSSLSPCKRHQVPARISLQDLVPEQILDKDQPSPPVSDRRSPSPGPMTRPSPREKGRNSPRTKYDKGSPHSVRCLRHGTISNTEAVKAVYLLMGGAAASSAMGYLGACSPSNLEAKAPDLPVNADFSGCGPAGTYHSGSPALDSPHYNSFDFEVANSDFDAFDCGGFTF